jgi:hypothetical protein
LLKAHQQERVPDTPPVEVPPDAGTVLAGKGSLRRFAPLPAARRSGQATARRAAPAGTLCALLHNAKGKGRLPPKSRKAGLI